MPDLSDALFLAGGARCCQRWSQVLRGSWWQVRLAADADNRGILRSCTTVQCTDLSHTSALICSALRGPHSLPLYASTPTQCFHILRRADLLNQDPAYHMNEGGSRSAHNTPFGDWASNVVGDGVQVRVHGLLLFVYSLLSAFRHLKYTPAERVQAPSNISAPCGHYRVLSNTAHIALSMQSLVSSAWMRFILSASTHSSVLSNTAHVSRTGPRWCAIAVSPSKRLLFSLCLLCFVCAGDCEAGHGARQGHTEEDV